MKPLQTPFESTDRSPRNSPTNPFPRGANPETPHKSKPGRRNASLLALLVILSQVPVASISQADTEISEEGRRSATAPKQIQSEINGYRADRIGADTHPPGRVRTKEGRSLTARPTQDVSVGITGCPGCGDVLDAVGGVFVREGRKGRRAP